jgi:hypothetical protein
MAIVQQNLDGTLTLTLTVIEQDTLSGLPAGQFDAYLTLWLQERATQVFQQRFAQLDPTDQVAVLTTFRTAGQKAQPVPVQPAPLVVP